MMEIAKAIGDLGLTTVVFAFLIYHVFFLTRKLITITENNTAAMTRMSESSEKVEITMRECHRD